MVRNFDFDLETCEMCGQKAHKLTNRDGVKVCNKCLGLLQRESREKKIVRPKEYK